MRRSKTCANEPTMLLTTKYDYVDMKMRDTIRHLSKIYEEGKVLFDTRMKWKLLKWKTSIACIRDKEVRHEYFECYRIIYDAYYNKDVSSLQKALYAKDILKL